MGCGAGIEGENTGETAGIGGHLGSVIRAGIEGQLEIVESSAVENSGISEGDPTMGGYGV